jgi:hypothetical protein
MSVKIDAARYLGAAHDLLLRGNHPETMSAVGALNEATDRESVPAESEVYLVALGVLAFTSPAEMATVGIRYAEPALEKAREYLLEAAAATEDERAQAWASRVRGPGR